MEHYKILFVSNLAADVSADVVADIARQARANNARNALTGLLVFDGEHFAQLIEGSEEAATRIVDRMESDRRHERMEILASAPTAAPMRYPTWRLGYLQLDLQEFGPQSLRGKRGAVALEAFEFMLPALDMAVGEAIPGKLARRRGGAAA